MSYDKNLVFLAESPGDLTRSPEMDKLKSVAKCYAYIETSSNPADIDKMTNGETSSYWQSDGSARSHWIRWVVSYQFLSERPRKLLLSFVSHQCVKKLFFKILEYFLLNCSVFFLIVTSCEGPLRIR